MREGAVVLENVKVFGAERERDLAGDREDVGQELVRHVDDLLAMVLGDDQLRRGRTVHAQCKRIPVSRRRRHHGGNTPRWRRRRRRERGVRCGRSRAG